MENDFKLGYQKAIDDACKILKEMTITVEIETKYGYDSFETEFSDNVIQDFKKELYDEIKKLD